MNIEEAFEFYSDIAPESFTTESVRNESEDFRMVAFPVWNDRKLALKICRNSFSTVERALGWRATIEEYNAAGLYCPRIVADKFGQYARMIDYMGEKCLMYAEEYSMYQTAVKARGQIAREGRYVYHDDAIRSIGTVATRRIDTATWPGGMCILRKFCDTDKCDEVMENALDVKNYIENNLPRYQARFDGIWKRYMANCRELKRVYCELPSSVFQSDLNKTNVLLSDKLEFVGMLDFNLSGRDTLLNYLFRESMCVFDEDVQYKPNAKYYDPEADRAACKSLLRNIEIVRQTYTFSELERKSAILVYRYVRPLWWNPIHELPRIKDEPERIEQLLDWIEKQQTRRDMSFEDIMT